ncbi:MAG TPA: hydrogenase maturation protein HypF [Gammaproteobacteria bacterium]|nr:hydrogenase maturation protein HypF [Gammaproteobacteria bacterium]
MNGSPSVLATGAWLKNTACLWMNGQAHWSPVHGDLGTPEACAALEVSVDSLLALAKHSGRPVQAVAHDLHPDFHSTRLAVEVAEQLGVPAIGVQHHQAHLAAVVAEHRLEGAVVGLALDGVGLGDDGTAWGGELLWLEGAASERLGHLQPLALPGGDRAAREPWRMAASVLHALGRTAEIPSRWGPLVGSTRALGLVQMLERGVNCPATSSAGRWFDAAAAALGLCFEQQEEAEAAIALEQAAARALVADADIQPLPAAVRIDAGQPQVLDLRPLWAGLLDTPAAEVDRRAAAFHLGLAEALADWLVDAARARGVRNVCLGGGCFFNRILNERVQARLRAAGLEPFLPRAMGCGDAGLAIGQAWVALHRSRDHITEETPTCA